MGWFKKCLTYIIFSLVLLMFFPSCRSSKSQGYNKYGSHKQSKPKKQKLPVGNKIYIKNIK